MKLLSNIFFWRRLSRKKRNYLNLILGAILVITVPLVLASLKLPEKAQAAWYDDNFAYRQTVAITNSGSNQTDFQISATLDTATLITAGKMQSDCDDIRIVDNTGKLLPHWIESGAAPCNSATTKIWTKAPSITTSGATVYIYYGNPSAVNAEKPYNVFEVFENFEDRNQNTWTYSEQGSAWSGALSTAASASSPNSYAITYPSSTASNANDYGRISKAFTFDGNAKQLEVTTKDNFTSGTTGYHFTQLVIDSTTVVEDDVAGNEGWQSLSGNNTPSSGSHTIILQIFDKLGVSNFTITTYFDNFRVRKYAATAPSAASPANEEKAPGPIAYWKFDEGTGTTAQDSTKGGNTATISNTTWQTEDACIAGKCLYFDGSTSNNTVANTIYGVSTVSMWVRPSSVASIALLDLDGGTHKITTNASGVISAAGFTSPTYYINGILTTTPTLTANSWQLVTVTTGTSFNSSSSLTMGKSSTTYFGGYMDEVKFYNYARTAAQVLTDYSSRGSVKGASTSLGGNTETMKQLSNGLVGYWKMDESSGNAADSSGNSNTGTWHGTGASHYSTGRFGNGGGFNGTDDYIGVPSTIDTPLKTGSFTIGAWVKSSDSFAKALYVTNRGRVLNGSNYYGINFFLTSTTLAIEREEGSSTFYSVSKTASPSLTDWNYVAVTYNKTTGNTELFLNNVSLGTGTLGTGNVAYDASFDTGYNIGAIRRNISDVYSNAVIDETRIYNRALSPVEVTALYNFAPATVGYWKFDENTGSSAEDSSGNGNQATLINTPTWTQGKYGAGINFAGSDQHVTRADDADFDFADDADMTIGAWIKHAATSTQEVILSKYQEAGYKIIMESDGDITCALDYDNTWTPTDSATSTAATYDDNNWHYISCVKSGASSLSLYIDGVLIATDSSLTATNTLTNSDPLYIGIDADGTSNDFIGQIDEVKIYNYARSAKQIVSDMNAGHPNVGSPVGSATGHWKFDEGADNTCSGGTNDACNSGNGGSALDGAGSNFASPATAASGWTNSGRFGKTLWFDGTDDVATITNANPIDFDTGLTNFTFSAWINADSAGEGNAGQIFQKGASTYLRTDNPSGSNLDIEANLDLATTDANVNISSAITTGGWHHIAETWDGTTLTVYIDGVSKGTGTGSGAISSDANNLLIGGTTTANFDGGIDDFKVYNFALTASQILLDMNRGQAQVLGALSDNSSYQKQAANQEYCVPGDTTSCAAPAAEWKLEEGTGSTAYDLSGNNYKGTWNGTGSPHWMAGKIGKAANFNGTDDYISNVNSGTQTSPFRQSSAITYSFWVNIPSGGGGNAMGTAIAGGNGSGGVIVTTTGVTFWWTPTTPNSDTKYSATVSLSPNTWYQVTVAVSFSGAGSGQIYVNGIPQTTTISQSVTTATPRTQYNCPPSGDTRCTTTSPTDQVGGRWVNSQQYFKGKLDNIRIYNYVRTAAQVAWEYNQGKPVGQWKFDECQGTTANDSSGNGNNGTITATSTIGTCTTASTFWGGSGGTGAGKFNYAPTFNGTGDFITTSAFSPLATAATTTTKLSWGGWFYPTTSAASKTLVEKATEFQLTTDANSMPICGIYYSAAFHNSSAPTQALTLSAWNHILCTYDGTNINTYLNGILIKQSSETNNVTAASSIFYIAETSGGANRFTGQIDDVRIYNYALTATQVKTLYNGGGAVRYGPNSGTP